MTKKEFDWKPGDRIRISLRGPCSEEDLEAMQRVHEKIYPGVHFKFTFDENPIEIKKKRWGILWQRL
jgi:hypothetical protein